MARLTTPRSRGALRAKLEKAGFRRNVAERLTGGAKDALALKTTPAQEEDIPLGVSKIGGRPDLPADAPWPVRPPYAYSEERLEREQLELEQFMLEALGETAPPTKREHAPRNFSNRRTKGASAGRSSGGAVSHGERLSSFASVRRRTAGRAFPP